MAMSAPLLAEYTDEPTVGPFSEKWRCIDNRTALPVREHCLNLMFTESQTP
jgi:hypothetical protein